MEPFKTGGIYLNFTPEGDERLPDSFGAAKYARLVALKDKYDPTNMFRFNQNVPPSGARLGPPPEHATGSTSAYSE